MSRVQTIVRRQWAIVRALHGTRRGKTIRALTVELGIPRATLYRDLGYLADAGVPIHRERTNGEVRLSLMGQPLPELGPAALELAAMRIARGRLTSLEGTALVEHLDGLLAKWAANGHAQSISIRSQPPAHDPEALRRIDQAIRRQRRLHFDYRAADASDYARREVDPLMLRLVDHHLYLIAWDLDRTAWRTFKVARMRGAVVAAEACEPHPPLNTEALFERSVKIWDGPAVEVAVRLAPEVAARAHEWPLHAEQEVEPQPDGSIIVRAEVAGIIEAMRWVLGWGAAAEALEPAELREAVREELAGALGRYERKGAAAEGPGLAKSARATGQADNPSHRSRTPSGQRQFRATTFVRVGEEER